MNAHSNHISNIMASSCRLFTDAQLDEI
ncbi:MAG: hypothetical protein QG588_28, partial [Candidatus Poribacteria bacterium]|nr:hypothetical protein [Candidatus Poribacteria bacterium]